jgi:oligopeptide transport system substrate-binding protein
MPSRATRPALTLARLLTGVLAVGIVGCGGGGGGPSSGAGAGGGSAAGGASGTLTAVTPDDIRSLDPALAFDTWSTAVVEAITRRLVDYDAQGALVPGAAEKWEEGDKGKTYTFHLRSGLKFADGKPIDASSFKAAIERVRDPKTASPGAGFYSGIERIDAVDPHTLVFHLKAPDPTFLNVLGMTFAAPIEPGQSPEKPAASGPYALEQYDPGAQVVLTRNPEYTEAPPSAAKIVLQLHVPEPLQLTRFQGGEVDLLPAIPASEYARVMSDPSEKQRVVQGVVNQTWYFGMNVTRPPWNDPRVRQAALLAIDRARHVQLAPGGQVANGILPPHVPGYDPNRKLPEQNVAEAKRLLAEAGYPNGIPEAKKSVMWLADSEQNRRHAEAIQSDLRAAGIPVELRPAALSQYLTGYRTNADCWYGGWYPDFPDAGNFFEPVLHSRAIRPGKSPNASHYSSPTFDARLDLARTLDRGSDRDLLYRQAEDQLLKDLPWIPLYYEAETRYFRPGVSGVVVHPVWRQKLSGIKKQ